VVAAVPTLSSCSRHHPEPEAQPVSRFNPSLSELVADKSIREMAERLVAHSRLHRHQDGGSRKGLQLLGELTGGFGRKSRYPIYAASARVTRSVTVSLRWLSPSRTAWSRILTGQLPVTVLRREQPSVLLR
jgi:hypothetical protein